MKADNLNDLFHFVVSLEGITTEWDLLLSIFIAMYLIIVMTSGIEWLYYNKNLKNKNSAHRS